MGVDPEAEAAEFTEAFRAVGLDAEVKKAPVPPEMVGELVGPIMDGKFPPGTGVTRSQRENCPSAWCGTVSIPVHFKGKVVFGIGRPAAPGERYATSALISPPPDGGPIDGYKARGRSVAEVRADMERLGLKITYVVMWVSADGSGEGYHVDDAYIKDDWTVETARKTASDAVWVYIEAGPGVPLNSLPRAAPLEGPDWWKH
ncbi:hypothetical protein [Nonomuraea sp. B19D2]|uniref:hypothetical protein n=1 Tax=Nonomuraea sp. B19D2 TaxID=3159561 RepID=UPI0032DB2CB6